jgi:hypothetical protein
MHGELREERRKEGKRESSKSIRMKESSNPIEERNRARILLVKASKL